jgi:hypothetical protein
MKNLIGPVAVLSVAAVLTIATNTPSSAQVIVNNVFSPFSSTVIGTGYGYYGYNNSYSYGYYDRPSYYYGESSYYNRSGYYERDYNRPRYSESPGYYRSGHYERGYNARYGYCWVATDRDRNFGYWERCR